MRPLLAKEFWWNWRSFRFPALLLVFLFFALLNPPTTKYMVEIVSYFAEMEGLEMILPDPSPVDAFLSVVSDLSMIGVLVMIFVAMGTVAREKETGVTGWMLSKPVGRWRYLMAKVINLYAASIAAAAIAGLVAYFYTWSLLGKVDPAGAAWSVVCLAVFMLFMASVTFACSTVLRSPLQAGGVAAGVFILSGMINMVVGRVPAARSLYPHTLLSEMGPLLHGASEVADVLGPLATTLVLSAAVITAAGMRFSRLDL